MNVVVDLLTVVPGGEDDPENRQEKDVRSNRTIALVESEKEKRNLRIHKDPLEPAELAGWEAGNLGEVEAAARRDRRDDEEDNQSVLLEERNEITHLLQNHCPDENSNDQDRDEDLPENGENRECLDDGGGSDHEGH